MPVSAGDPVGSTYVPGGGDPDLTIAHLQAFNFNLGGEFVTDPDPGATGLSRNGSTARFQNMPAGEG